MRVVTKFQSPYDKYLFEGIINPEDYYSFVGTCENNVIKNEILEDNSMVCLYVLNTLDHNVKVEPHNPDNIITKFFSGIKRSFFSEDPKTEILQNLEPKILKNILLISIQPLNLLHNVIEYFISLEKSLRPNEEVMIYTISSLTLYKELSSSVFPRESLHKEHGPSEKTELREICSSYGKHTFIDLSLALTAIELFKRRKLVDIYRDKITGNNNLKGIGIDLLNHHDKVINTKYDGNIDFLTKTRISLHHKLYVPKISSKTINLKLIAEFLDTKNKSDECRIGKESYFKRLVPLIPKFNYRIYDKLETFVIKNFKNLYNVLIINTSELRSKDAGVSGTKSSISFKNLLYISVLKWNLIFITFDPENSLAKKDENEDSSQNAEYIYTQLSEIYNNKTFNDSRNELRKLNPDYSLLRDEKELEIGNLLFSGIEQSSKPPHIMVDTLCGIKSYLKKLESSLEVDNIKVDVCEI